MYECVQLLSSVCKAPDHSMLTAEYALCNNDEAIGDNRHNVPNNQVNEARGRGIPKRYKFNNPPAPFMNSDTWRSDLESIIVRIQNTRMMQEQVDELYDSICRCIFSEMDRYLESRLGAGGGQKRLKNTKPYWCEDLTCLWRSMNRAEREFLKCKSSRRKKAELRAVFINCRTL